MSYERILFIAILGVILIVLVIWALGEFDEETATALLW
jgi:hypothetical protein